MVVPTNNSVAQKNIIVELKWHIGFVVLALHHFVLKPMSRLVKLSVC